MVMVLHIFPSFLAPIKFVIFYLYKSLFCQTLTQARWVGYSLLFSLSFTFNISCEGQNHQALFLHNASYKFHLSLSVSKKKCSCLFYFLLIPHGIIIVRLTVSIQEIFVIHRMNI